MGARIRARDRDFLLELDRLLRDGLTRAAAAEALGITNQTISYRLKRAGVRVVWEPRLGSSETLVDLQKMLATNELEVVDESELRRRPGPLGRYGKGTPKTAEPALGCVERNELMTSRR